MRATGSKPRSAARQIGVSSSAIQRAGEQKSTGPRTVRKENSYFDNELISLVGPAGLLQLKKYKHLADTETAGYSHVSRCLSHGLVSGKEEPHGAA